MLSGYSKVYGFGHRDVLDILDSPVVVTEKIDGSQISFGVVGGELSIRSRGAQIYRDDPPKLFKKAVEQIVKRRYGLVDGYIYRGEYLSKPCHNTLAYDRTPKDNIILFDIDRGYCNYMPYDLVAEEAAVLGFEVVPLLIEGLTSLEELKGLLGTKSILGGQNIEGVVIKNYKKFTSDKKVAMAKVVDPAFQELHQGEWRKKNPNRKDVVASIVDACRTQARWQKAVQHLRELDQIEDSPKDIGKLIAEVKKDVKEECEDDIKQILFDHFWGAIHRQIAHGLPEWYKERLAIVDE